MTKRVVVPALTTFEYDGQTYRRDDPVSMTAIDAAKHARAGRVSLSAKPAYRTNQLAYQTRQMVAENRAIVPDAFPDPDVEIVTPRPRRRRREATPGAEE
jgi:hypothetical protein